MSAAFAPAGTSTVTCAMSAALDGGTRLRAAKLDSKPRGAGGSPAAGGVSCHTLGAGMELTRGWSCSWIIIGIAESVRIQFHYVS